MDGNTQNLPEGKPLEPNHKPAWIGGVVLIIIGVFFLIRTLTGFTLNNWWALFILIPAVTSFGRVITIYQAEGVLNSQARGALIGGVILTFIAIVF